METVPVVTGELLRRYQAIIKTVLCGSVSLCGAVTLLCVAHTTADFNDVAGLNVQIRQWSFDWS